MRIKLTIGRAGPRGSWRKGAVVTLPDDEARRLVEAGQAIPVIEDQVETAMVDTGDIETREATPTKKRAPKRKA